MSSIVIEAITQFQLTSLLTCTVQVVRYRLHGLINWSYVHWTWFFLTKWQNDLNHKNKPNKINKYWLDGKSIWSGTSQFEERKRENWIIFALKRVMAILIATTNTIFRYGDDFWVRLFAPKSRTNNYFRVRLFASKNHWSNKKISLIFFK